jgi:hypothetical protein
MPRIESYLDVLALRNEWRQYWEPSKRIMEKAYRWYMGDVPIATPRGWEAHPPPTATSLVNDSADHLAGDDPYFRVRSVKEASQKADVDRERLQYALNAAWSLISHTGGHSVHRSMALHGGWSGMMVAFVGVHDDWDVDKPDITDIYIQEKDPRHVYPDPGSLGRKGVIYTMQRRVGEIRASWPDWEGHWFPPDTMYGPQNEAGTAQLDPWLNRRRLNQRLPDTATVDWVEYWDDTVKCFIANGVPVFTAEYGEDVIEHGLGINPWIIRSSGYGFDAGEADKRFRGLLQPVFHLLDAEARIWNQWKWIIEDSAWPALILPSSMKGFEMEPGKYNWADDPNDIKAVRSVRQDQVKPEAIIATMGWVEDQIERATYPVILKGEAPSGIRAGYPIAILSTQAKMKFAAPTDALKDAFKEVIYKILAIVENRFEASCTVIEDYSLTVDDHDKYLGRISIDLEPKLPTDLASKLPVLEFYVGSLGGSKTYASRELGIDQVEELRQLRMVEDLEDDPRIKQGVAEKLLGDMLPDEAAAVGDQLESNLMIQKMQESIQQLQGQIQMITMQNQLQQLQNPQPQPTPEGVTNQGSPQAPRPGPPGIAPPAAPPGMVAPGQGSAGGTNAGQNLQQPGGPGGQNRALVNPQTQMSQIARQLRANRTIQEMQAQETSYGG